jgi:4-hydroxy-3-polyprenylbenzoate decarboxylase
MLDHATQSRDCGSSKLGIDATEELPGEGLKRSWPPSTRTSDEIRRKVDVLFGGSRQCDPTLVR